MSEGGSVPGADGGLSRRRVLGGAGRAAAAGAALTAAGAVVLPEVAAASGGGGQVAVAPKGTTSIEFVAQIDQAGTGFLAYGFLTDVFGLGPSDLFTGPASETNALFTAFASGNLTSRAVHGSVHALDVEGDLSIYHRTAGGASFGDPSSFKVGTLVADYSLVLQDILTVTAPNTGIPTLLGDLKQTHAVGLGGGHGKFGKVGLQLRLVATGIGTRLPPDPPVASLSVAGNLSVS